MFVFALQRMCSQILALLLKPNLSRQYQFSQRKVRHKLWGWGGDWGVADEQHVGVCQEKVTALMLRECQDKIQFCKTTAELSLTEGFLLGTFS